MTDTPPASAAKSSTISRRREAQFEALMEAAEKRIVAEGVGALKARDLAGDIGIALGGLYNIVADMDDLMLRLAQRTMGRLDAALEAGATVTDEPVAQLQAIALAYYDFARQNLQLWRALFEMRLKNPDLPEWNVAAQLGLFRHMNGPMARLMPDKSEMERTLVARTLFAAVHGIAVIGLEERLIAVPPQALAAQIRWLVRAACKDVAS
ncbi:TetR-like C-terminal domain-containing protein [Asticcacaulis sp. BYS171W]|uniref:TetR-like C-terminal domain-containing protein n=1 Tax=Asticcacaulis aquaticus TaxID=2984212 RepID=A0ABT5HUH1_9CAUL|nr:TetR-like C-terminal domain-containing protein [Asticcacaulis aquaticus]MDC7683619.1 TetR-like C-terminal domain-containing protein [Asticcacaulis aquaticus]